MTPAAVRRLIPVLVALLVGCRAQGPSEMVLADPAAELPDDWSIDATVMVGPDAAPRVAAHRRPSRFVLFPDGSLHAGEPLSREARRRHLETALPPIEGQPGWPPPPLRLDHGPGWLPERTRTLDRRQMEGVWARAHDLGFADPERGELPIDLESIEVEPAGATYLMVMSGGGRRWMLVQSAADGDADPAAAQLIRHLAALAWVPDEPEGGSHVQPPRYDLGPDPYARYRAP